VIATVTMPGGLVRRYQHQRDDTPDPDRRRDAERVLEDLRSLCRAAQAYAEHGEDATLIGCLEQAAGLHSQVLDASSDRRIAASTIHRAKGTEAQAVALLPMSPNAAGGRRADRLGFLAEAGLYQTDRSLAA
jgi:DNA helicase-2/ATP-dependent DNA helicase PcrA